MRVISLWSIAERSISDFFCTATMTSLAPHFADASAVLTTAGAPAPSM